MLIVGPNTVGFSELEVPRSDLVVFPIFPEFVWPKATEGLIKATADWTLSLLESFGACASISNNDLDMILSSLYVDSDALAVVDPENFLKGIARGSVGIACGGASPFLICSRQEFDSFFENLNPRTRKSARKFLKYIDRFALARSPDFESVRVVLNPYALASEKGFVVLEERVKILSLDEFSEDKEIEGVLEESFPEAFDNLSIEEGEGYSLYFVYPNLEKPVFVDEVNESDLPKHVREALASPEVIPEEVDEETAYWIETGNFAIIYDASSMEAGFLVPVEFFRKAPKPRKKRKRPNRRRK